jgi:hypothetical protein
MSNTFYSVDAETCENTTENMWSNGQPKMPAFLAKRAKNLSKQFHGTDFKARQAKADENRQQNISQIQGKAKMFIQRAEQAHERRKAFGENNATEFTAAGSPFKLRGNMADKASKDVINHQKSTSPVNVASNLEARFATFESNRAGQMDSRVAKARKDIAKVGSAKKKAQQLHAQGVLTAGFMTTTVAEDNATTTAFGWGSPMKLPARLSDRAEALQQRFMYSPTTMQQKAAANRKAFLDGVAAKAAKTAERAAIARARKAAMSEKVAGMYTVFTEEAADDTFAAIPSSGWTMRAQLPPRLRKRYATTRKKFLYDSVARQAQVAKNREAFLMNKRIKARTFSSKAEAARDRKALAQGDANTFSFSADPEKDEATAGWGAQRTKLPKRLTERVVTLQAQFKKAPFTERDQAAKIRRKEFYAKVAAKARSFSGAPQGAGAYTFNFDGNDAKGTANGWTSGNIKLPVGLQARYNKVSQRFKSSPHTVRQQRATANRNMHLAAIAAKGKAVQFKVQSAQPVAQMEDAKGFFSVSAEDGSEESQKGWGVRTRMPERLAKRCTQLQSQFKKAPYSERNQFAAVKREMFYNSIAMKARATRSMGAGNSNFYSVVPADEEEFKMTTATGWGKPNKLPKRLKTRVAFLTAKFARSPYAVRNARADVNREVFHNSIRSRGRVNAIRAEAAKERRAEFKDNMVIFGNIVPVTMPPHLAERNATLKSQFAKQGDYAYRRENAATNRENFHAARAESAAQFSNRVIDVQARKAAFAVNMNLINVNGPVDSPVKMPKRLEKRVVDLHNKFHYDDFEIREARIEANRQSHLSKIRAKAQRSSERAKAAAARRAVQTGEAAAAEEVTLEAVSGAEDSAAVLGKDATGVCSKMRKKSCIVM